MKAAIRLVRSAGLCAGMFTSLCFSAMAQGGTWTSQAPLPAPRDALAVGVVNGRLYAIGGYDASSQALATNQEYDPTTNAWTTKADLPTPRRTLAAGVIGGRIYAVGGWNGSQLDTVEAYDPATDTWTTQAGMPTARDGFAIAVLNDKLYAIGGSAGGALSVVEVFDPSTNSWAAKAPLPVATWNLAAAAVGGKVYAIGGSAESAPMFANVFEYDPDTDAWLQRADMPTARAYLTAFVVNSTVYAVGGDFGGGINGILEEFNPALDTWTTDASMPTARKFLGAGVIGTTAYAVGGDDDSGPHAVNEAFTPTTTTPTNLPPTANAGADRSVHAGQVVHLDGSGSFDDNTPSGDLVDAWTITSAPAGSSATLSDAGTTTPSFTLDLPGIYVVELTVTDADHATSTPAVIHISSLNGAPSADAGTNFGGVVGTAVALNGSASSDPDHDVLSYHWSLVAKPRKSHAALVDPDTASPDLTPDVAGTYTMQLVVNDGFVASAPDTVAVTVVTPLRYAESLVLWVIQTSKQLPVNDFASAGNKKSFEALLIDASHDMQHDELRDARKDLKDALSRTDGWTLRGRADTTGSGRDWITDATTSVAFYAALTTALNEITVDESRCHEHDDD